MRIVLSRVETMEESLEVARPRQITIEDQIGKLRHNLQRRRSFKFADMIANPHDRTEIAVTLLALLELIKRREARAQQGQMFGPIEIMAA